MPALAPDSARGQRQNDPENHVSQQTGTKTKHGHEPKHANDRGIHVEVIGKTGAHARNFLIRGRAHQSLRAAGFRRESRRWSVRLFGAAAVAESGPNRDIFSAIRANHGLTLAERIFCVPLLNTKIIAE
jgi:hypothetical protein